MGTYYDSKTKGKRVLTFGLVETILNTSLAPIIVHMTGRRVRLVLDLLQLYIGTCDPILKLLLLLS